MNKFELGVDCAGEEFDGEFGFITITNRAGRKWIATKPQHRDNIDEELLVLFEIVNDGGKLDKNFWRAA